MSQYHKWDLDDWGYLLSSKNKNPPPKKRARTITMKKRTIIREIDYNKLPKYILDKYRVDFKPLTKSYFEKRSTFFYLKGKKYVGDQYALYEYPKDMIRRFTGIHLYKSQYLDYLIKYNDSGELVIRAGLRQPECRLGLATLRKK